MDILTGTIRSYDRQTHTANIQPNGSTTNLPAVPVAHHVGWWEMQIGHSCCLFLFDATDLTNSCVAFVWGSQQPNDPRFDPSLGHRHRGIEDDAPAL